jgi:hypothetical protein
MRIVSRNGICCKYKSRSAGHNLATAQPAMLQNPLLRADQGVPVGPDGAAGIFITWPLMVKVPSSATVMSQR